MKSERRHELQQNSLAHVIENFPLYVRKYADRVLLVIVLILLVIVVIRWRTNAAQQRQAQIADDLATSRAVLERLKRFTPEGPPDQLAGLRGQLISQITTGIDNVANESSEKDTQLRAQALVTRGDLYWTLANLPPIPGATTQPMLGLPKTADEYLQSSEDAYKQVLSTYPNEKNADIAARFGLAAIAEDRHQWSDAQQIYDQIKNSDADKMYKDLAESRASLLPEMEQPLLFGSLTTQPSNADLSGVPLDTSSLASPTTLPITIAAPSTSRTTSPSTSPTAASNSRPGAVPLPSSLPTTRK